MAMLEKLLSICRCSQCYHLQMFPNANKNRAYCDLMGDRHSVPRRDIMHDYIWLDGIPANCKLNTKGDST